MKYFEWNVEYGVDQTHEEPVEKTPFVLEMQRFHCCHQLTPTKTKFHKQHRGRLKGNCKISQ